MCVFFCNPSGGFLLYKKKMEEDKLFVNLTILGFVKPHQRINATNQVLYLEGCSSSFVPIFVRRLVAGDSRLETVRKIHEIIHATQLYLTDESTTPRQKQKILELIAPAQEGVANLLTTYSDDVTTVARFKYLLSKMGELSEKK